MSRVHHQMLFISQRFFFVVHLKILIALWKCFLLFYLIGKKTTDHNFILCILFHIYERHRTCCRVCGFEKKNFLFFSRNVRAMNIFKIFSNTFVNKIKKEFKFKCPPMISKKKFCFTSSPLLLVRVRNWIFVMQRSILLWDFFTRLYLLEKLSASLPYDSMKCK